MSDFWKDKDPCWKFMDCPECVYKKCPAYLNPEGPCWEAAYTQCEILINIRKDCKYCKVYRVYSKFTDHRTAKVSLPFMRFFDQ